MGGSQIKKYLIISGILICSILGYWYANIYYGLYIDLQPNAEIRSFVKTDQENILIDTGNGFEPFIIKGVTMDGSLPGYFATDYKVDEETYLRWFKMIDEMGANTIRLNHIMDDDFYNAFYEFNNTRKQPLYLLQSIWVEDYVQNSSDDAYGDGFFKVLKANCRTAVDVIHGKKTISLGRIGGSGRYRKDVSKWTIGYIVGNSWTPNVIAYTDNSNKNNDSFSGKYIFTTKDSSPFENLLAEVMNDILLYESQRYKEQRLVSYISEPSTDPFEYTYNIKLQSEKIVKLDANHIKLTGETKSGFFASYRIYNYITNFSDCLDEVEMQRLSSYLKEIDIGSSDGGYMQMLNDYHDVPVLVASYGFSTARGTEKEQITPLTERQQGESLIKSFDEMISAGCCGAVISIWQDTWFSHTWNTQYAVDKTKLKNWCDNQSIDQKYGILSFDPGLNQRICYVDGEIDEWNKEDLVSVQNNQSIYSKYDEEFVYFMVSSDNLSQSDEILIPIDTTQKSGSYQCNEYSASFERQADFMVLLNGKDNSCLYVQDYYDSTRAMYEKSISGVDPYISVPDPATPEFTLARLVLKSSPDPSADLQEMTLEQRFIFNLSKTHNTGILLYGNGNPYSDEYNSQADFMYGNNCVEVRIPWQLLNFSDPSSMSIHDDYYENYGVENIRIRKMYVGVGKSSETLIEMKGIELNGWGRRVRYHERLKQSYFIIQERWR